MSRSPHIPVAVVSGLTVGILSGILVLRSGGGARAEAGAEAATEPEAADVAEPARADAGRDDRVALATDAAAPLVALDAGLAVADAGDDVADEAEDAELPVEVRTFELRFDVIPNSARGVRITVDGQPVQGRVHAVNVEGPRRRVRVAVRARGFLTWRRQVTVGRDRELTVELERPAPSDDGPGGLIDL